MSKATENLRAEREQKMQKISNLIAPPRITKEEKDRLRTVFGHEPEIYLALRDCFFGFELDDNQRILLKSMLSVKDLLTRLFLPEVKKEISFGNTFDLWQTMDVEKANSESFDRVYDTKIKMIEMIKHSLERLENPDLQGVNLEIKANDFPFILARNGYVGYVNSQIRALMEFSLSELLTDAEVKAMLQMNSSK